MSWFSKRILDPISRGLRKLNTKGLVAGVVGALGVAATNTQAVQSVLSLAHVNASTAATAVTLIGVYKAFVVDPRTGSHTTVGQSDATIADSTAAPSDSAQ